MHSSMVVPKKHKTKLVFVHPKAVKNPQTSTPPLSLEKRQLSSVGLPMKGLAWLMLTNITKQTCSECVYVSLCVYKTLISRVILQEVY